MLFWGCIHIKVMLITYTTYKRIQMLGLHSLSLFIIIYLVSIEDILKQIVHIYVRPEYMCITYIYIYIYIYVYVHIYIIKIHIHIRAHTIYIHT